VRRRPGCGLNVASVCTFCDIARGEKDAYVVFEDETSLAFLDHRPLFPGHCLLITRAHHETLADLPRDLVGPFFLSAQLLDRAVEEAIGAEGSFVAINNRVSQSVPHLHVHIVPRNPKDGLRGFFWPRNRYEDDAEMALVADRIRVALQKLT
jgi:histidine triad (HIT) family protein